MLFSEKTNFLIFVDAIFFEIQITRQRHILEVKTGIYYENLDVGYDNPPLRGRLAMCGEHQRVTRYPQVIWGGRGTISENLWRFPNAKSVSCILRVPLSASDL